MIAVRDYTGSSDNLLPGRGEYYSFRAMGSPCSLQFYTGSQIQADMLAPRAIAEIERIEAKYTRYNTNSVLSVMNQRAGRGETVDVDDETASLLDYAFAEFEKSHSVPLIAATGEIPQYKRSKGKVNG